MIEHLNLVFLHYEHKKNVYTTYTGRYKGRDTSDARDVREHTQKLHHRIFSWEVIFELACSLYP